MTPSTDTRQGTSPLGPEPPQMAGLTDYIGACKAAAARSRFVLLIIVITSVLVFAGYWNSREQSWVHGRRKRLIETVACLRKQEKQRSSNEETLSQTPGVLRTEGRSNRQESLAPKEASGGAANQGCSTCEADPCVASDRYRSLRHLTDLATAERAAVAMEDLRVQWVDTIHVPVVGVVFDVNDLSIIGGIAFIVSLLWMVFSGRSELDNVLVTLQEARRRGQLEECYQLLTMEQVFTRPFSRETAPGRFWRRAPLVLFVLPWIVQTAVVAYDTASFEYGTSVEYSTAVTNMMGGLLCWSVIGFLSYVCVDLGGNLMRTWDSVRDEIDRPGPSGEGNRK